MPLPGEIPAEANKDELPRDEWDRLPGGLEDDLDRVRAQTVDRFNDVVVSPNWPQERHEQFADEIRDGADGRHHHEPNQQDRRETQDRVDQGGVDQRHDDKEAGKSVEGEPALVVRRNALADQRATWERMPTPAGRRVRPTRRTRAHRRGCSGWSSAHLSPGGNAGAAG